MLDSFEVQELETIYRLDKQRYNLHSSYVYSFSIGDNDYVSELYYSYQYWKEVYEIAKLQYFNKRFVNCEFDNTLKYHHAINYVLLLLRKKSK